VVGTTSIGLHSRSAWQFIHTIACSMK
jgi:hypothetical protein